MRQHDAGGDQKDVGDDAQFARAPSELSLTIAKIKRHHRERCFFMEQRKRQYLALGAFLRTALGWSLNLPEKERKALEKRALEMIDDGEGEFCDIIGLVTTAARPFEEREREAEKAMGKLAKTLPAWAAFGEPIRGFGEVSLAVIVAEAGDLSDYPTIAKLRKRMGLAPFGEKALSTWRRTGGLKADDWLEAKYSPVRRSRMWNIGDALIKGNRDGKYRTIYLRQKEKYQTREGWTKMHAHLAAQRYMEQCLLKDLWLAWRREAKIDVADRPRTLLSPSASLHHP